MRQVWLDYERPDPERRRPGMAVLAVGAVAAILAWGDYLAVAAERDELQAEVQDLRRAAERQHVAAAAAETTAGAKPARAAAVPPSAARWEALFASLEAAADDSVTLLTLHPTDKEIALSGEARDFASSIDYVERLQAQPALVNARLTQSEVVAENPRRPVRFSVVADWRNAR